LLDACNDGSNRGKRFLEALDEIFSSIVAVDKREFDPAVR
jgi:hypothetical protein